MRTEPVQSAGRARREEQTGELEQQVTQHAAGRLAALGRDGLRSEPGRLGFQQASSELVKHFAMPAGESRAHKMITPRANKRGSPCSPPPLLLPPWLADPTPIERCQASWWI